MPPSPRQCLLRSYELATKLLLQRRPNAKDASSRASVQRGKDRLRHSPWGGAAACAIARLLSGLLQRSALVFPRRGAGRDAPQDLTRSAMLRLSGRDVFSSLPKIRAAFGCSDRKCRAPACCRVCRAARVGCTRSSLLGRAARDRGRDSPPRA